MAVIVQKIFPFVFIFLVGCSQSNSVVSADSDNQAKKGIEILNKENNKKVYFYELDNGLRIVVKRVLRSPVITSQIWYKVGSSFEHSGISGISHMLEHMMFKGTKKYPKQSFSNIVRQYGGSQNAFTGKDYTAYYQNISNQHLSLMLELEADRMKGIVWNEEEFIKERDVVIEERKLRTEDKPRGKLLEEFYLNAFDLNPYRIPVIGWMSDIENYQMQDAIDWFNRWYAPNNAILVVVGSVNPAEVYDLAKQHFAKIPSKKITKDKIRLETKSLGEKRRVIYQPINYSMISTGYLVPSLKLQLDNKQSKRDIYTLEVIAGILSAGHSSRFSTRLVKNQKVASQISASYNPYSRLDTIFTISGVSNRTGSIEKLEQAIDNEINLLRSKLVSQAELNRVIAQVKANYIYKQDYLFYQGYELGLLETVGLGWQVIDEYEQEIGKVTVEDIMRVSNQYFINQNKRTALLLPEKK